MLSVSDDIILNIPARQVDLMGLKLWDFYKNYIEKI